MYNTFTQNLTFSKNLLSFYFFFFFLNQQLTFLYLIGVFFRFREWKIIIFSLDCRVFSIIFLRNF